MRRAQEDEVRLAGALQVVGELAGPAHQGRVFDAAHRLAAAVAGCFHGGAHAFSPVAARVCAACCTAATMFT